METLRDYVRIYKFDIDICKEIVQKYSESPDWHLHKYSDPITGEAASSEDRELENLKMEESDIYTQLLKNYSILSVIKYHQDLNFSADVHTITEPRLNKYKTGTIMRPHCDHIRSLFDGERKGIPVLSVLGALNNDYQGGEFILNGNIQPLKAGEIIVFPSNFMYPHEVKEVTEGTRYSVISWAY